MLLSTLLFSFLISAPAKADTFRNSYISFNLPNQWSCDLHGGEWVCRPNSAGSSSDAIIVFTAKIAGPLDSLAIYEQKLNSTRLITNAKGEQISSQIQVRARPIQINGQTWLDGHQFNSEVANYHTRYAATIKGKLAVLATFSAHRRVYPNYATEFYNSLLSLRVLSDGSNYFTGEPEITTLPTFPAGDTATRKLDPLVYPDRGPKAKKCIGIKCYMSRRNIIIAVGVALLLTGLFLLANRKNKK